MTRAGGGTVVDEFQLRRAIADAWAASLRGDRWSEYDDAIEQALGEIDAGNWRAATLGSAGDARVDESVKQAILLALSGRKKRRIPGWPGSYDRLPLKMQNWTPETFERFAIRVVPGAVVRYPAHIGRDTVLMPSFVNAGASVGDGCMIDTWATVGSCAQIGRRCHISGGAGIGGVLEPLQSRPVIIEDDVFVGARSEVAEGVIVRKGAVLAPGCFVTQSTKIVDRRSGMVSYGEVPAGSVVVPGYIADRSQDDAVGLQCLVIVKTVDQRTREKVGVNELLRL